MSKRHDISRHKQQRNTTQDRKRHRYRESACASCCRREREREKERRKGALICNKVICNVDTYQDVGKTMRNPSVGMFRLSKTNQLNINGQKEKRKNSPSSDIVSHQLLIKRLTKMCFLNSNQFYKNGF